MENMLATVDKVFKVEIMKMPPSLQNTLIGDLISGEPPPVIHKVVSSFVSDLSIFFI